MPPLFITFILRVQALELFKSEAGTVGAAKSPIRQALPVTARCANLKKCDFRDGHHQLTRLVRLYLREEKSVFRKFHVQPSKYHVNCFSSLTSMPSSQDRYSPVWSSCIHDTLTNKLRSLALPFTTNSALK